jgi:hypothetical protein
MYHYGQEWRPYLVVVRTEAAQVRKAPPECAHHRTALLQRPEAVDLRHVGLCSDFADPCPLLATEGVLTRAYFVLRGSAHPCGQKELGSLYSVAWQRGEER